MNNIDILEDFLDYYSYLKTAIGGDDIREFEIRISKNEIKAISNLIAENKDLKEMLKHRIEYTNKLEEDLFQNASNYVIPKSKVKEKIKELETMYDGLSKNPKEHLHSKTEYKIVIGVLQELLDERNNTNGN